MNEFFSHMDKEMFQHLSGKTFQQIGQQIPATYVITAPLPTVDAGLWRHHHISYEKFGHSRLLSFKREQITLGTVHYSLYSAQPHHECIMLIELHSMASQVVEISVDWPLEHQQPSSKRIRILRGLAIFDYYDLLLWFGEHSKRPDIVIEFSEFQRMLSPTNTDSPFTEIFKILDYNRTVSDATSNIRHDSSALVEIAHAELAKDGEKPPRQRGAPADPINEWARTELKLGRDYQEVFAGYLRQREIDLDDRRAVARERTRFKKAVTPRKPLKQENGAN